jgi:acetate kinase
VNGPLLVLNAGSSSVKFAAYDPPAGAELALFFEGSIEEIGAQARLVVRSATGEAREERALGGGEATDHAGAIRVIDASVRAHLEGRPLAAAGHRVVHGGLHHDRPVRIDPRVLGEIEALVPLAPLHQPHALTAIRALAETHADLPQVACFDTAFHRSQAPVAQAFGLPRELGEAGLRRYGFHGISYESVTEALSRVAPGIARGRVVIAHLGNGASLCAIRESRSVATTMGFTALDGLLMGTRPGSLDPGVLLYLMESRGMDARALEDLLYHRSGLLGVSGLSSDMRTLLASDAPSAREAVDLFVYRIRCELGAMAAALGGLDALVFTAGIGENAAEIRARVCRDAAWLGIRLDERANAAGGPCISKARETPSAWVIPTDENGTIARHTREILRAERSR